MLIVCRYVVQSPGRDDAVQHLEVRFDYEAPPMVEPKSSQPTPEKKRVAQPETWKRFKWSCNVVCSECSNECTKLPLQDPPLCDKSCKLNCAEAAPVSLRETVRKLRHAAYSTGKIPHCAANFVIGLCCCLGGRVKLKQLLRRYVELIGTKRKRHVGHGGRNHQAVGVGQQTCAYCRLLELPAAILAHDFIPYVAAHQKPISANRGRGRGRGRGGRTNARRGRQSYMQVPARGCTNYEAGKAFFEADPQQQQQSTKRHHARYYLPNGQTKVEVCSTAFKDAFAVGRELVASVRRSDATNFEQQTRNNGSKVKYAESIKEQIKNVPWEISHYTPYREAAAGKERVLPKDLNATKLWKLWLLEHDPEFHEQAKRIRYWRSYDRKERCPVPFIDGGRVLQEGEAVLKPKCSHTTYFELLSEYDLVFGGRKVDTCPKCDEFATKIAAFEDQNSAECMKLKKEQHEHHVHGDKGYKMQTEQMAAARKLFGRDYDWSVVPEFGDIDGAEFQSQDAGGNCISPELNESIVTPECLNSDRN